MVSEEAVTDLKGNAVTPPLLKHVHHDTAENCRKCHKTNIQSIKTVYLGTYISLFAFFPRYYIMTLQPALKLFKKVCLFLSIYRNAKLLVIIPIC